MIFNGQKVPDGLLPTGSIKKIQLDQEQATELAELKKPRKGNRVLGERRHNKKPKDQTHP
jgi:hypothetical protein